MHAQAPCRAAAFRVEKTTNFKSQGNTSINAKKTTKGLVAVETTQVKKISFVNNGEVLCFSGNSTKTESRSSQTDPLSKIMHALEVPA